MYQFYLYDINTYQGITKPTVTSTISVEDWLSQIKQSQHSNLILKARNDESIYDKIKFSMPCVTYNFLFNGYKKNTNIISSTGIMYLDIDNPLFNIDWVDLTKVYAYYRSFGGHGFAILVKVNNLSVDNFSSTYEHVASELGISEYVDLQAAKASQFNVLSFDENLYLNEEAIEFDAVENSNITIAPRSIVLGKRKETYTTGERAATYTPLRFSNIDEIPIQGEYVVNWDGYDIVKCFIPMKKRKLNQRNSFLLSYCNNLVWLNKEVKRENVYQILSSINQFACEIPVDNKQLFRVLDSVFGYLEDGTLEPKLFWKQRKIVFHQSSKLTRDEKLEICRSEFAIRQKDLSTKKLYAILENWDFQLKGEISQRKIYKDKSNHIGKNTVEKYWNEFKDWVAEQNKGFNK